jgi:WD40 repeat protein
VGIRDVAGLREISSFRLPEPVRALQFSPDARYAATGSADQTARVWDVATGRELARMSFDFGVFDVSFNHRGDRLAVSGLGPDVFIESWRPEDLLNDAAKRTPRNLTLDEWQQYLPDEPCRPTFATLPDDCQPVAEDD